MFDVVGMVGAFTIVHNQCMYNTATKRVDILVEFTCSAVAANVVVFRVPERFRPSQSHVGMVHRLNGQPISKVGCAIHQNGYITQSLTGGCTEGVFQISYYI